MMINFKIYKLNKESLIIWLFSILPLIDSFNGFMIESKNLSIGTMFKLFIIIIMFFLTLKDKMFGKKRIKILFGVCIYVFMTILINYLCGGEIITFDFPIKLIFNIITLFLLIELLKRNIITGTVFYKIFDRSTIFMILCIIVPYIMGTGFNIYSGGIGYKGFFYSQNELVAILIILFYFSLYNLIYYLSIKTIIQVVGMVCCVLLTNTKSGIIVCVIGIIVLSIEYIRRKESKYKFIFLIFMIINLMIGFDFIFQQYQSFMLRQTSLSNMYNNSLLMTLTSGRILYLQEALNQLNNNTISVMQFIIGNGFCSKYLVEMDFVDMFFYLGFIGLSFLVAFYIRVYKIAKISFKSDRSLIRKIGFFIVIAYSSLTGHVIFMATSGCYFVLMCLFDMYYVTPKERVKNESIL